MVNVSVQTDIQDLRSEFVVANPNLIVIQDKRNPMEHQPLSYPPPPIYYPEPVFNRNTVPGPIGPPVPYPAGSFGWWGGYSNRGF